MMKKYLGVTAVLLAFGSGATLAEGRWKAALDSASPAFNWRVRYEGVDQAGFDRDASALTTRLRAGIVSGAIGRTRLLAEIAGATELSSKFNSTTNGQVNYPVVADPGGFADINRLALVNQSLARTELTFGRQRLILDDARFVGNVGWRQNEQTFDGIVSTTSGENFSAGFAWFNQVNRIYGADSPNGEWHGDLFLINGSHSFSFGDLMLFVLGMEFDEAPAASNDTLGIKFAGSRPYGDISLIYSLAYASQRGAGNNPADYSESYSKIETGLTRGRITASLGREVLGGNGSSAFVTPLATLHAFQGWADKFLATPANGMEDSFLRIVWRPLATGPFDGVDLAAFYHEFGAMLGSDDYGDEIDLSVAAHSGRIALTLKYSTYEAGSLFTADTDKLWFSMDYSF